MAARGELHVLLTRSPYLLLETLYSAIRNVWLNSRTGVYEQSRDDRNVYYHAYRTCVASHFLDFDAIHHIKVDAAVKLSTLHLCHLREEFDVRFL